MKKKIIALATTLMLFAGVVSASSINGDYKGNPIVKVMSNGKQLEVDEVPAQIYDGHTVVPISLLRQLGASVDWNQDTYSVDVKLPVQQPASNMDLGNLIVGFNERAKEYNASNVKLVFNELGGYISADINLTGDNNLDAKNVMLTSSFVAYTPAAQIFVNLYQNNQMVGFYDIHKYLVESYINNEISADDFTKSWTWKPNGDMAQPTVTQQSNPSPSNTVGTNTPQVSTQISKSLSLYSNDGKVYLGKLTSNEYDSDSIYNAFGTYGNPYQSLSIFNEFGTYGSKFSSDSAFNQFTSTPPIIVYDGTIIGFLTVNSILQGAVSPIGLKEWLKANGY